ncbi:allantoinase AllB [Actinocatenispora rupis]|uniref:allantoinase n=1 Tax=Actinocatenispora rupis TaxID=519421 RepID=A0A8J3J2R7_9ACTN|nr:allantoinase AllB [Actinocatenispora rupis]GID11035.1 allantoinase [Actinocatenispora rupis]
MTADLVVRSRRAVLPDGERPAAVYVHSGRIVAVEEYASRRGADSDVDLADVALLPGLVDTHVHVDEPGRTEWEGFATATAAAAAGGVTTLVDMPLNSIPPTVDVPALRTKRAAADGACRVDVGFWGGAVPGNLPELARLHEAGVFGFKCFLSPSGVAEFGHLSPAELEAVAAETARLGALLIVHAEDPAELREPAPGRRYAGFLDSRPPAAEYRAVARLADLAERTGARIHVLHVSSAGVAPLIAGSPLTAETCPHYLTLAAETIPDGLTAAKCCPPVRDAANRERLWHHLAAGTVGCVVSDHSPATADLKESGDFATAWGGVSSLQLGLPLTWTGARRRGYPLAHVVRWMASGPAALVGLRTKGSLAVGCDADLVAFAPDETFTVDVARLRHRHPVSPYAGWTLTGVVRRTWLRGVAVTDEGAAAGRLLAGQGSAR